VHVPAKIHSGSVEPIVDHLGDLRAAREGAVEDVVVDPILGEQCGERCAVTLFDGVAECAEHGGSVHGVSPDNIAVMPRESGASSIPERQDDPRRHGVLDRPHSRTMTVRL